LILILESASDMEECIPISVKFFGFSNGSETFGKSKLLETTS